MQKTTPLEPQKGRKLAAKFDAMARQATGAAAEKKRRIAQGLGVVAMKNARSKKVGADGKPLPPPGR